MGRSQIPSESAPGKLGIPKILLNFRDFQFLSGGSEPYLFDSPRPEHDKAANHFKLLSCEERALGKPRSYCFDID